MSGSVTLPDGRLVDSLKVVELKKELEVLGLDKNGLKKDLVRRLSAALSDPVQGISFPAGESLEKIQDESVSNDVEAEGDSTLKCDEKSGGPTDIDQNPEPDVGNLDQVTNDVSEPKSPEKTSSLGQKSQEPIQEKVESSIPAEVVAPQVEATKSPVAEERAHGSPPPVVEVAVELHEEEEDYGDEETEETVTAINVDKSEKPKKDEEKSQVVKLETSKLTSLENINGGSSFPRKPASPPSLSNHSALAPVRKETRGVGFTVEAPERVNPPSEAKCPPSNLVYIRCLVRPFTACQLATMLETHFGLATELWLNRIKSTAVARFSNESVATKCREGLDGCRWPSINPRILQCEFASEALFSWLKEHGEAGDKPPPRHLFDGSAPCPASTNEANGGSSSGDRKRVETLRENAEATVGGVKRRRLVDVDGAAETTTKEVGGRNKWDTKGDEPSKSLDDLFRKTAATPSVYWLPLSDEAAAAQLKTRRQTYLAESTRRPVPRRNVEERRRENRSPFTGEFGNGPSASASNPLALPDPSSREKRPRERTPSPGEKRLPRERRRSPSPRRPRYANRTPSPRFGGSAFATASTGGVVESRRPPSPPSSRYRRRTPPRR